MIKYDTSAAGYLMSLRGSLLPKSFVIASPCAIASGVLRYFTEDGHIPWLLYEDSLIQQSAIWGGFSVLVAFMIIFRTSQSYARFWEGCQNTHQMRAEWFDACSALIAFTRYSDAPGELKSKFQHSLIRLVSMLHSVALAELEDAMGSDVNSIEAFKYELLDVDMMEPEALNSVKESSCKVELVYQWIQMLIVENIKTGVLSIAPPILSRCFQELSNGMVAFNSAIKISWIPFPFPYAQMCAVVLVIHWFWTPFITCTWTTHPAIAVLFSFTQVFILWALDGVAKEIENPFGMDENDIDGAFMQLELNEQLLMLVEENQRERTSCMMKDFSEAEIGNRSKKRMLSKKSFRDIWEELQAIGETVTPEVSTLGSEGGISDRNSDRNSGRNSTGSARDSRNSTGSQDRNSSRMSHVGSMSSVGPVPSIRSLKQQTRPRSAFSWFHKGSDGSTASRSTYEGYAGSRLSLMSASGGISFVPAEAERRTLEEEHDVGNWEAASLPVVVEVRDDDYREWTGDVENDEASQIKELPPSVFQSGLPIAAETYNGSHCTSSVTPHDTGEKPALHHMKSASSIGSSTATASSGPKSALRKGDSNTSNVAPKQNLRIKSVHDPAVIIDSADV